MQQFTDLTGARLQLESLGAAGGTWPAAVTIDSSAGSPTLVLSDSTTQKPVLRCNISPDAAWRAGETVILVAGTSASKEAAGQCETVLLKCSSRQQAQDLWQALQSQGQAPAVAAATTAAADNRDNGGKAAAAAGGDCNNKFDAKTDKGSADLYFHYYGMLQHQQNMLQDMTRTGTYHAAIVENRVDFEGKTVMDVGAGSGILSLFAAQAGARKVFAVEASGMANFAQQLADKNPVGKAIQVCHSKVEALQLPEGRVDVLVSEPMGTLLVNERMLETYLYARDHFLKPGGKMFPQLGRIHAAAFSDPVLHNELLSKALFWQQPAFYGIDMTALHQQAVDGYFAQVVVDAFDPSVLVSDCATRVFDFSTMKEEELYDINIPLSLTVAHPCTLHGIACWFDVLFNGTTSQRWLSTAPGLPTTHWFQLRCVLQQPLLVLTPNTQLTGVMRLVAHERQSYDVHVELCAPPVSPGMPRQKSTGTFDMKEPYYRQLTTWAQQAAPQQLLQQQQYVMPAVAVAVQQPALAGTAAGSAAAAATDPGLGGSSVQGLWAAAAAQQQCHGPQMV